MNDIAKPADAAKPAAATDRQRRLQSLQRLLADGALDLAMLGIQNELKATPNDPSLWALKASAMQKNGKPTEALQAITRAAELAPDALPIRIDQARLASEARNDSMEIAALRAGLKTGKLPDRLMVRLITLLSQRKEYDEALAVADQLVALKPGHEPAELKRAAVLSEMGRAEEARAALEVIISRPDCSDYAITTWAAHVAEKMGRFDETVDRLKAIIERGGPNVTWHVVACLGKALNKCERLHEAIEVFRQATVMAPEVAGNWYDMGVIQRLVGLTKESQEALERSLELDPSNAGALRVAGYEHKYEYGDEAWKRVNVALGKVDLLPRNEQVEIHYAAAKALEDVGELEAAFAQYAHAGRIQKEQMPWSDTRMRGVLAMLRNMVRKEDYEAIRRQVPRTEKPVFVVGMPRSGTTLLEQVMCSHPQVYGAGELKLGGGVVNGIKLGRISLETIYDGPGASIAHCGPQTSLQDRGQTYLTAIERIAGPNYTRVVDKMPGNFNWVGVLDAILPGAKFIHARRHPVEICLSEYRLFFPDGINFSYDLRDLGKQYRLYNEYMTYWTELMGDKMLHVRYEDMVEDFENQAHRVIEYLGLPWDDACLRFYETERKVATASVTQVRKPIYKTSVNRWRKYEPYLGPLLEELGPLVKAYEDELEQVRAQRETATA